MPFLRVTTSAAMDAEVREALRDEIAGMMNILPGKTRENTMIHLEGGEAVTMGDAGMPCAFLDLRLFKPSPEAAKAEFVKAICNLLNQRLGIEPSRIYINLIELMEWGSGGNFSK